MSEPMTLSPSDLDRVEALIKYLASDYHITEDQIRKAVNEHFASLQSALDEKTQAVDELMHNLGELTVASADLQAALEEKGAQADKAYEIVRKCATSLGNGAAISPECTPEFHALVPAEIYIYTNNLRSQLSLAHARIGELERECQVFTTERDTANDTLKACSASFDVQLAALTCRNDELAHSLTALIKEATLLQQSAEGCAAKHHGHNIAEYGLPGWLADTKAAIGRAAALASPDQKKEG